MKADNLREVLAQASEEESREIFQEATQRMARLAFFDAMEAEVNLETYQVASSQKNLFEEMGERSQEEGERLFTPGPGALDLRSLSLW